MSELVKAVEEVKIDGEEEKGPSKGELKRLAKKAEKEAKKAEYKAANASTSNANTSSAATETDESLAHLYGDLPLICSKTMTSKSYKQVSDLSAERVGQTVWIRARLHTSRAVGKGCFFLLRQGLHSVQAIAWQGENVPKALVKYCSGISLESVVDGKNYM